MFVNLFSLGLVPRWHLLVMTLKLVGWRCVRAGLEERRMVARVGQWRQWIMWVSCAPTLEPDPRPADQTPTITLSLVYMMIMIMIMMMMMVLSDVREVVRPPYFVHITWDIVHNSCDWNVDTNWMSKLCKQGWFMLSFRWKPLIVLVLCWEQYQ